MNLKGNVLITGGAGYLGRAIVRRAVRENWDCQFTILSRDPTKHHKMQTEFPKCRYIIGDVEDRDGLIKSFSGHDLVIHAAAQKHIPEGENNVGSTMDTNYQGSREVARAAIVSRVSRVVGISTDKACHPVNVYGASKFLMERTFQEYNSNNAGTKFNLVRYGNVLSSTGSVLTVWKQMLERDGYVTATDPDMTRFWLTVDDAVDLILKSLDEPSGTITIPECKALDMRTFAEYTMPSGTQFKYTGLRPGEKRYEELLTKEERDFTSVYDEHFCLWPTGDKNHDALHRTITTGYYPDGFRSDNCERLTQSELLEMLK